MRKIALILVILLAVPPVSFAGNVKGYWRDSDGDGVKDTYVEPHQRTNPNRSRMDNYSYPGNYNPNTGRITPFSNSPKENYPFNPNPNDKSHKSKGGQNY
jgi:hypothetical protein